MEVLLTKFSFALENTKQLAKIRYKNLRVKEFTIMLQIRLTVIENGYFFL